MNEPSWESLGAASPPGSSWSVWRDRRLGTLNRLGPESTRRAAAAVVSGRTFALDLPLATIDPPLFGRARVTHRLTREYDAPYHDDVVDNLNPQAGTQWDGLRHARHPVHGWYGGLREEEHGVEHWATRGIVARGVLVDVAEHRAATGRPLIADAPDPITPDDLDSALRAQGTELEPGDVLCVRTGWLGWYRERSASERAALAREIATPGLQAGRPTLAWLWDHGLAAVAADNPAVEVWPFGGDQPPQRRAELAADPARADERCLHQSAIPLLGLVLGELFDLDGLAADCAADRRWEFCLTAAPWGLPGGASSPANALALR